MGNVTAKTSGEIASFMSPSMTNIKSLKVHFSPKQLGTGDPSPENVREIVGWDGVEVNGSGKNIAHIVGYAAKNSNRSISNSYGTTINTTEFLLPDTELVVTQTQSPNTSNISAYQNGYLEVLVDNLVWGQKYRVSFKIDNITSNPLNADLKDIKLLNPYGTFYSSVVIDNNRVIFNKVLWKQYSNTAINRRNFEIRNCGMSFTLSEFMVTPVDDEDFEYEPYQGMIDTVNWSDEIGTVYGGYVDLVKGELIANMAMVEFDGSSDEKWQIETLSSGLTNYYMYATSLVPKARGNQRTDGYICSNMCIPRGKNETYTSGMFYFSASGALNVYLGGKSNTSTVAEFKSWLMEHKLQVAYWLAEPIHYQLTPQQLLTLKGTNNIWSNSNSQAEVKFWTH